MIIIIVHFEIIIIVHFHVDIYITFVLPKKLKLILSFSNGNNCLTAVFCMIRYRTPIVKFIINIKTYYRIFISIQSKIKLNNIEKIINPRYTHQLKYLFLLLKK